MKLGIIYDTVCGSTFEVCKYLEEGFKFMAPELEIEIMRPNELRQYNSIDYFIIVGPLYGGMLLPTLLNFIKNNQKHWSQILGIVIIYAFPYQKDEPFLRLFYATGLNPLVKILIRGMINFPKVPEMMRRQLVEHLKSLNLPTDVDTLGKIDKNLCIDAAQKFIDKLREIESSKIAMYEEMKLGIKIYFTEHFNRDASLGKKITFAFVFEDLNLKCPIIVDNGNLIFPDNTDLSFDVIIRGISFNFAQIGIGLVDGTALRQLGLIDLEGDENLLYDLYLIFSLT